MIRKRRQLAWLIWGIMIFTYILNNFHGSAMGVLRQEFLDVFSLTDGQYVLITNCFSYAYMVMQIPAGILLDKYGARRIVCIGCGIAAVGSAVFAGANGIVMLCAGRVLLGLGCSVGFLSTLKICSEWFEDRIFCTMSGVTGFVGMMGGILAQAPLSVMVQGFGWRRTFGGVSVFTVFIMLCIFCFVADRPSCRSLPDIHEHQEQEEVPVIKAVSHVLMNKRSWLPMIVYGCFYGTYLLLSGIYGTSMVQSFYGCPQVTASSVIMFLILGCAVGSVLVDIISDRLENRRFTQFWTGILYIIAWSSLGIVAGRIPVGALGPLMFIIGFGCCAYSICWSSVKECNDPEYVGISTSIANMGGYLGIVLVPTVISLVYDNGAALGGETVGFRGVIVGAVVINIIGTIAAWFVTETHGRNIYHDILKKI